MWSPTGYVNGFTFTYEKGIEGNFQGFNLCNWKYTFTTKWIEEEYERNGFTGVRSRAIFGYISLRYGIHSSIYVSWNHETDLN